MALEFHRKFSNKFEGYFFKKLELHGKLKFQKYGSLLNISQTVIYCKIFCKRVVFGHLAN